MSGTHLMDARRSLSFWASAQLSILNAIYAPVTQPADNWQLRLAALRHGKAAIVPTVALLQRCQLQVAACRLPVASCHKSQ